MIVGGLEAALGIMTHPILFNRKANLYILPIDKNELFYKKDYKPTFCCHFTRLDPL